MVGRDRAPVISNPSVVLRSVHVTRGLSYPLTAALASVQRHHGESRAESGADHRLLVRNRPEDGRDAGQG